MCSKKGFPDADLSDCSSFHYGALVVSMLEFRSRGRNLTRFMRRHNTGFIRRDKPAVTRREVGAGEMDGWRDEAAGREGSAITRRCTFKTAPKPDIYCVYRVPDSNTAEHKQM